RTTIRTVFTIAIVLLAANTTADTSTDMKILSYPVGVVAGKIPVEVDLGATGAPAELFLDGTKVCSLTAARARCMVDLEADPHVHLLELLRQDASGKVTARTTRWINRPGDEAELSIRLDSRTSQGICHGHMVWFHPLKKDPLVLQILENGRSLRILDARGSFAFPCPDPSIPHMLAASAIFPDGRRAEGVALSGGFGGETTAGLTAVPLAVKAKTADPCKEVATDLGDHDLRVGKSGFEVVFVLDPSAAYITLYKSGWFAGRLPRTSATTKVMGQIVQHGERGSEPRPHNSWKKAEASLIGADKLWFVLPDQHLQRANGFSRGKMNWLQLLFDFGPVKLKTKPRLADAVVASGLVAAAGPRRRAVVLLLGDKASQDSSSFTPSQAREYLAEVGVPLFVLRNGKVRDDGWPKGYPTRNMESMQEALEHVRNQLDRQCVAWFRGELSPNQVAALLPADLQVAGRGEAAPTEIESVWRRAELGEKEPAAQQGVTRQQKVWHGRVEVSAVTVLVKALDSDGKPVSDLDAGQLQVAEDGRPAAVLGLERIPALATGSQASGSTPSQQGPARKAAAGTRALPVSVYVDRRLGGSADLAGPLNALAERADWLTSLGPVDVAVADRGVEADLVNGRDPKAVREALEQLAAHPSGRHAVEAIRTRFLRDIKKIPNRLTRDDLLRESGDQTLRDRLARRQEVPELSRSQVLVAARSALLEEDGLLRQEAVRLSDWALASPATGPRLLLVVGAGFDEDPVDFYLPFVEKLEPHNAASAREEFKRYRQSARVNGIARALAAAGWLVMPVAGRASGSQTSSAEFGGGDRFQAFLSASPEVIRTQSPEWLLLDPVGMQEHLAGPSGGEVVMGAKGLDRLEQQASGWYQLTYQLDRGPDGAAHELAVTISRPGIKLSTTRVIASETTEGEASARLDRLMRGSEEKGDLGVSATVSAPQRRGKDGLGAILTVNVDAGPLASLFSEGRERIFRVSLEVRTKDAQPFFLHRLVTANDPQLRYEAPLQWPAGQAQLAVTAEDLGTGAWGGTVQELPTQ
ncbi:MAG: DUF3631 domain-containing protein, partial [Acidobacteria bacterium]|nr:DUF3631 domain-containing protein [Acidobacteriota bacterium]